MTESELIRIVNELLEETRTGVLATVDADGRPHMRWMTPVLLDEYPGALFALTSPDFPKSVQIESRPKVEWMIQSRLLDRIVNLRGTVRLVDNPSLKASLLEKIGGRLHVLWKVNEDYTRLTVVETVIEEGSFFRSMEGTYEHVTFETSGGAS